MMLTKNFSLEEMTASETAKARGIKNEAPAKVVGALALLCGRVLQPLRDWCGRSVKISSGYRCAALNRAVGGVATSQHVLGEAADINIEGDMERGKAWFEWIEKNCVFDQLIMEHNRAGVYWIHVSYREGRNRRMVIRELVK